MVPLFLRITGVVALALIALWVLGFVIHVLFVAALVAALVVAVTAVAGAFRRRRMRAGGPVATYRRW